MSSAPAYPIAQTVLANGLRVVASPDHNAPVVAVNLWYGVGSRHEEPGRTGLAHLFEHLMFQGSANVAVGEHFALLNEAGGVANATTFFDRTNYFEILPAGGLDLALWLEADRLASLSDALTGAVLAKEREVVKEEKRELVDNAPYGDAFERQLAMLFAADHPYGHEALGSMADLDAAGLDDVKAFFDRHYLPNNAVLTVAGDVAADEAFATVDRYLGAIPAGELPSTRRQPTLPPLTGALRADLTDDVPEPQLFLGWRLPPAGTREFDAAHLALTILGQGEGARAVQRLTRQERVARSLHASTLELIAGNSLGFLNATPHRGVTLADLEQRLLEEVERLARCGPTEDEIRRAQALFELGWLTDLADLGTRADRLSESALLHGDAERVNTRVAQIGAVDARAIREAVATWLAWDARTTLTYRPRSAR